MASKRTKILNQEQKVILCNQMSQRPQFWDDRADNARLSRFERKLECGMIANVINERFAAAHFDCK